MSWQAEDLQRELNVLKQKYTELGNNYAKVSAALEEAKTDLDEVRIDAQRLQEEVQDAKV